VTWRFVVSWPTGAAIFAYGGRYGLPAEFMIASDGRIMAVKYGIHADDQWSADELLALAAASHSPLHAGGQNLAAC
jgi:hypothetical protein